MTEAGPAAEAGLREDQPGGAMRQVIEFLRTMLPWHNPGQAPAYDEAQEGPEPRPGEQDLRPIAGRFLAALERAQALEEAGQQRGEAAGGAAAGGEWEDDEEWEEHR